jgi:DNA-binding beta-propeller fold protein YncE
MKRSITNDTKQKMFKDTFFIKNPWSIIQTPCGKFLIGVEGFSIFRYNLETKEKFRIAGSVGQNGHKDGTRDESRFDNPKDLILSKDLKTLFVSDSCNQVIRSICVGTGVTTTFAGQFRPNEYPHFKYIDILKLSPDKNTLFVFEFNNIKTICIATGQIDLYDTFENESWDFKFSPDSKNIYICCWNKVLKYNLETGQSEIVLKGKKIVGCELSKNGQLLFISNLRYDCIELVKSIKVVNLVTNQVIDNITLPFEPSKITISTNGKQLYICDYQNNKIQVLDISNYCTNFKTFIQLQLAKHSFLPPQVIKTCSI